MISSGMQLISTMKSPSVCAGCFADFRINEICKYVSTKKEKTPKTPEPATTPPRRTDAAIVVDATGTQRCLIFVTKNLLKFQDV